MLLAWQIPRRQVSLRVLAIQLHSYDTLTNVLWVVDVEVQHFVSEFPPSRKPAPRRWYAGIDPQPIIFRTYTQDPLGGRYIAP
jgi:hypothetical protein